MTCNCRAYLAKAWNIVCLLTVEPAIFLVALGFGMSDTATQVLMYDKVCIMLLNDLDRCIARNFTSEEEIIVQQEASVWEFYRTLTSYLPAVFLIVIYSNLVDRWSKKYTIFFCPVGSILSTIVYLVCSIYMESSPAYMLLGTLMLGLSGGLLSMLSSCFSYLSATASQGMLLIHLSLAEAALLGSSAISSFASGVLLEAVGYVIYYFIGIVIYVILCLYVLIRIKNIPLSASVTGQPAASSSASEPSKITDNIDDVLKQTEASKQNVDDELMVKTNHIAELENAGHVSPPKVHGLTNEENSPGGLEQDNRATSQSANGVITKEKSTGCLEKDPKASLHLRNTETRQEMNPGCLEQNVTIKSCSENRSLSRGNCTTEKVTEIQTFVQNGSLGDVVALSILSDGLPIPSQNSANDPQLELILFDTFLLDSKTGKSTTCGTCSPCIRAAWMLWFCIRAYINTAARRREHNKRRAIIAILCIILFEVACVYATEFGLCYLFVTQQPLSWSTSTYGYYLGVMKGVKGFCLLVILPLFKRLNVRYTTIMVISLVSSIFGNTVFALSLYTWMAFLSVVLTIFEIALIVTARSFVVTLVEEDEHGKAFGMVASLESLAFILSTIVFNIGIYPATVSIFAGLAILIAALILLIPLAISIWLHVFMRNMVRLQLQVVSNTIEFNDEEAKER